MKILGEGRQSFLDFLRNLTPQALLLAVALSMWARLDFGQFDISNWEVTAAFFACAATLFLAVVANTIQFIDSYSDVALKAIDARMTRAKRMLPSLRQRISLLWRLSNRSKWNLLFHFVVTLLVAQVGLLVAVFIGVRQAIQLIR